LLDGRNAVIPEDIQAVLPGVASHRLQSTQDTQASDGERLAQALIGAVTIP
jgi:MoxR-like ATPase